MIHIAILGCGGIAAVMAKTVNGMKAAGRDVCLYAGASRSMERAEAFCKTWGVQKAYGSYEEMIADPAVDLVYVATPHSHHAEHMKLCIEAGKAVLCEKAFTGNARQAEEVLNLAKEKGVPVLEAIWPRYAPSCKAIRELVDSGRLGDVKLLTGNLGYDITMNERIVNPALAGGALLDLSVYTLTFASIAFGDEVVRIQTSAQMLETGVDCTDQITLTYKNGRTAQLMTTSLCNTDRHGVIYGSKGWAVIDNVNNPRRIQIFDKDHRDEPIETLHMPEQITGYEYEVDAAIETIEKGWIEHPAMTHAETLLIMRQMDEIRRQWGMVYPFD